MRLFKAIAFLAAIGVTAMGPSRSLALEEIEVAGPLGPLRGSLLRSLGNGPVALVLAGSGPTDRHGDQPTGIRAAPYRLLAEALAAAGVSSLRVDKRGMFGSARAIENPNAVTIDDYAGDAATWVARLVADGARCVWLIGHSEGGLVALRAAQLSQSICGVVLASAPGRRLGDVLREQLAANPANAPINEEAFRTISGLEGGAPVDVSAAAAPLRRLFHPEVQGFLISTFRIDPAKEIARLRVPILIVQGDADMQVGVADADRLATANAAATRRIIRGMNHVWKSAPGDDRAANLATYRDPDLPLAAGFAETVATFILSAGGGVK
jgi:uncharacterized protein